MISALPYDHEEFNLLAMKVGGEGKWRSIGRYHWEKEAKICGYPAEAAIEYLVSLVETLPAAARSTIEDARAAGLNVDGVLVKLVEELEKRCAKLYRSYAATAA